jgi:uncharacterized RDD family membrane protein YckC
MSGQDLRANPYVGLRPFFADDSLYFFGREQQTAELIEILRQHRFLGVVGSSGSGKSSLVSAGLLPGLLGGFLVQDRDRWHIIQMKPGDAPIANLASGLLEAMEKTPTREAATRLEKDIREGHTDAVLEFLTPRLESNANLFILVDQFEEIFAFRGSDEEDGEQSHDLARRKERARRMGEAADFVDLLLALAQREKPPIYVGLAMRTDFLGDCDLFYGLPEALNRGRYLVPRMTREQLRQAIECPALLPGAQIAPRLMDHLLNELGDRFDRLPVLQHALLRSWDEWQHAGGGGPIDLRHFESAGGLERALDQDAEAALEGLDIGITARVFQRLTDTDLSQRRVRSPARISELMAAAGADRGTVEEIVRRFKEDGRSFVYLSRDGKPDDPRVDISHESLIRQWDRLRKWVDEERRSRDEYRDLVTKARKWGRGEGGLLQDPELQTVVDRREKAAPSPGWASRYAVADDDFECARAYVDKSVDVRFGILADAELQGRWTKIWILLIMPIEAGVGLWIAKTYKLLADEAATATNLTDKVATNLTDKANADWRTHLNDLGSNLIDLGSFFFSWTFVAISLFLAVCVGLNLCAKWVYRRFAYAGILREIKGRGKATELQDALVAHHTSYAGILRRVGGYLIDFLVQLGIALVALIVVAVLSDNVLSMVPGEYDAFGYCVFLFAASLLYGTLQITSKRQATLGMRAVGIFRTDLHGRPLSFGKACAWWFYRLVSYPIYGLGFLGFLSQPFTRKRQTVQDWLAGSVVLRRPQATVATPAGPAQTDASTSARVARGLWTELDGLYREVGERTRRWRI